MSILHELAEQSRRGKVAYQSSSPTLRLLPPRKDWAMPSFDFGDFYSIERKSLPPFIPSMQASIEHRTKELQKDGFVLPFERCAFVTERRFQPVTIEICEMVDERIKQNFFYRGYGAKQWFFDGVDYFYSRELEFINSSLHIANCDRQRQLTITGFNEEKLRLCFGKNLMLYLTLLSMGKGEVGYKQMAFVDAVNRGRAKADLPPIPATVSIRLNPMLSIPIGQRTDTGEARCPHERRAHVRRLKSGRIIKVRASKIHGGSDSPPTYRVIN